MNLSQAIEKSLETLKHDIIRNAVNAKTVASGDTNRAFEVRMVGKLHGQLWGAPYAGVLERGRKEGKLPYDFKDILKRWVDAKGLTFDTDADLNRFVYFVTKKIREEGTALYRSGKTNDIFETPIKDFEKSVQEKILHTSTTDITNKIFEK